MYKLGLLAEGIHDSVLHRTYQFFGDSIGVDVDFQIFDIPQSKLDETVELMRAQLHGFTVTMPYKIKIMDYCDELDESAQKCGSTNTVLNRDGKLIGFNTDGWGMLKCLDLKDCDLLGKKITMVGAGGAALSIAYNLTLHGIKKVDVLNVFEEETNRLVSKMGGLFSGHLLNQENLTKCTQDADVFINASILGQVGYGDYEDLSFLDIMKPGAIIFDVNYSNLDAKLPAAAKSKHIRCYVGKAMSSCQGIRAMEIWTGKVPSDETARQLVAEVEAKK